MATKKATAAGSKKASAKRKVAKKTTAKTAKIVEKQTEIETKGGLPRPGALIAEFIGAFVLTGAFFALFSGGTEGIIGIALTLIALVIIFGVVSKAHFNPAVSIALWANRKFGGVKTLLYVVVQVVGALLAFLVFRAIYAATNGVDLFAGPESLVINELISNQGVTQEMIDQAGGLLEFAKSNGFDSIASLAERVGISLFVNNDITENGLVAFFAELIGAIIFGFGAGVAYLKAHKPVVKALALGFSLFAGIVIGGSTVILNPAVAAALGSFSHGWGLGGEAINATAIMWPIITYIVATIAGVIIGLTGYRFLLKDADEGCGQENCGCTCHK